MPFRSKLTNDHLIAVVATHEISAPDWRRYVMRHWHKLMWRNSRMLVLAGIHGGVDGEFGEVDEGILRDCRGQIPVIRRKMGHLMEGNNISIDVIDIGAHFDRTVLDEQALNAAIRDYNPTVLVLAFCYTDKTRLNQVLRNAGIYSLLFLQDERSNPEPFSNIKVDCSCQTSFDAN